MSVFRNYDKQQAGGVNANAFPRVYSHPWIPSQRNVRSNPNIPSQPQRIQPQERGTWHPSSASGGGSLAAQMSSGCGSCGGCAGCGQAGAMINDKPPTASEMNTGHTFPTGNVNVARGIIARPAPRSTGIVRPAPVTRGTLSLGSNQALGGRRLRF
jgi:hypothetical protein